MSNSISLKVCENLWKHNVVFLRNLQNDAVYLSHCVYDSGKQRNIPGSKLETQLQDLQL